MQIGVKERIRMIRLIGKLEANPAAGACLGITVSSGLRKDTPEGEEKKCWNESEI